MESLIVVGVAVGILVILERSVRVAVEAYTARYLKRALERLDELDS
jgi:hypothetical protein